MPFSRHDVRWGVTVSGPLRMMLASKTQIIAAIYETVLRPELVHRFSLPAEQRVEDVVTSFPFRGQKVLQASEIRTHFSRAFEILEQQWRQAGEPGYSSALTHPDLGNLDEANPTGEGGGSCWGWIEACCRVAGSWW